ncbi:hypothetical protein FRC19_006519 [Serendipita sp. 401]|nr:hypothetical protein FRC19_006519 [Serendipita sp. 401]KAG9058102.1 hypothetical protein FS842_001683 [Serendipita sp. 407]
MPCFVSAALPKAIKPSNINYRGNLEIKEVRKLYYSTSTIDTNLDVGTSPQFQSRNPMNAVNQISNNLVPFNALGHVPSFLFGRGVRRPSAGDFTAHLQALERPQQDTRRFGANIKS